MRPGSRRGCRAVRSGGDGFLRDAGQHRRAHVDRAREQAVGREQVAWSEVEDAELRSLPYEEGTERSVSSAEELRAELVATRARGYAFNDRELDPGFRTIGIPVLDPHGRCRFALGLRGPVTLMIDERVPFFVELAKVTATEIAATFATATD